MKFLLFSVLLSSSLCFASNRVEVYPNLAFPEKTVSVAKLCIEGEKVRTSKAVSVCDAYADDDGVAVCVKSSARVISLPKAQAVKVCVAEQDLGDGATVCSSYAYQALPESFTVKTAEISDDDGVAVYDVVDTHQFKIPACN
jgi:hypothetical protein